MDVFAKSAKFYDSIYDNAVRKNYDAEAAGVAALLGVPPASVLEYGAGTGCFAIRMQALGYSMVCTDPNPGMRAVALGKGLVVEDGSMLSGAVRGKVDHAIAMFAVVSYAGVGASLGELLASVRESIKVGGKFVFDFLSLTGIAHRVYTSPREEVFSVAGGELYRTSAKYFDLDSSVLTVTQEYCFYGEPEDASWSERHVMMAFCPHEIRAAAKAAGFTVNIMGYDHGVASRRLLAESIEGLCCAAAR